MAVIAGAVAGSISLVGFGIDNLICAGPPGDKRDYGRYSKHPEDNNNDRGGSIHRPALRHRDLGAFPTLVKDKLRDHASRDEHTQRNEYEVVKIAEDGNGIWNEVNWTERVARNACCKHLCIPRNSWVLASQIEGVRLYLKQLRPSFPTLKKLHDSELT